MHPFQLTRRHLLKHVGVLLASSGLLHGKPAQATRAAGQGNEYGHPDARAANSPLAEAWNLLHGDNQHKEAPASFLDTATAAPAYPNRVMLPSVSVPGSDVCNVSLYGAKGDGVADDTAAFQAAFAACQGERIVLPRGTYNILGGVLTIPDHLRNSFTLEGENGVATTITVTGSGAFLRFDGSTTPSTATRRQWPTLRRLRILGPGKGVAGSIGLHINNAISSLFEHVHVENFETNVFFDAHNLANGAACYYNNGQNLTAKGGKTNIRFAPQANSNTLTGGRASHGEIGVEIAQATTNVTLTGMSIESNTVVGAVLNGYGNHLLGCRLENPTASYEVHFNRAAGTDLSHGAKNTIISYLTSNDVDGRIRDDSTTQDNMVIWPGQVRLGSPRQSQRPVLQSFRYADADATPMADLHDRYTSSGSPIGFRHTAARAGTIGFEAAHSPSPFTTTFPYWQVRINPSNGKSEMWFGAWNSAALDTNLYRDTSDRLATDDYFRVGTVTALPPASAAYRGYMVRREGADGIADALYICHKTASNTYTWQLVQ